MNPTDHLSPPRDGAAPRHSGGILENDPTRIKTFDFAHHEALERGRLRLLRPVLETAAGRCGSTIASAVRQLVHVELDHELTQLAWEEYAASLPDPTYVSSTVILPLERRFILHIPFELAVRIVDFILGGDGTTRPDRNDLTEIELALLSPLVEMIWRDAVVGALSTGLDLTNGNVFTSDSPILIQIGRPGELCLIVRLNVAVAESETHAMSLCMPVAALSPVIDGLERLQFGAGGESDVADAERISRNLLKVPVDLKVSYCSFNLTPTELLNLQLGDVIRLGSRPEVGNDLLQLVVDDAVYAYGVLVEDGRQLTFSVTKTEEERS